MHYKAIISIEKISCERVSQMALYETVPAFREAERIRREGLPPESLSGLIPQDSLLLIVNGAARFAFTDLGVFMPLDYRFVNRIVHHGDADAYPVLDMTVVRMGMTDLSRTVIGQMTFRHDGAGNIEWECGADTATSGMPIRPGLYAFDLRGAGARYTVYLRGAILDCRFEEFSDRPSPKAAEDFSL
ncbi:MAG: hypothetical protein SFU56_08420 [Capsulimonadales bacterium]|nr:hypothetical protein [Capsulimonadales bacterium]